MIILVAGVVGAVLGYFTAKRRKGNGLDKAQYAAGYAIALMIVALFLSLILENLVS